MKKATIILLLLLAAPAVAQEESVVNFESELALTTDYTWRGVSRSDESVALQGEFEARIMNGFEINVWASSVDGGAGSPSLEMQPEAAFMGEMIPGLYLGAGARYYLYSGGDEDADSWFEYFGQLRYKDWAELGVDFSTDVFSSSEQGLHYRLELEPAFSLCQDECPGKIQLLLGGGYYDFDDDVFTNSPRGYWHFHGGVGTAGLDLNLSVIYHGTNKGEELFGSDADHRVEVRLWRRF